MCGVCRIGGYTQLAGERAARCSSCTMAWRCPESRGHILALLHVLQQAETSASGERPFVKPSTRRAAWRGRLPLHLSGP